MPLDVRIISGGSTYYLTNSTGSPVSGGSATGATTTPYSLIASEWTLTTAPRRTIYSGGPPFRVGSSPLYNGYGNVTEEVKILIAASSADNMALLIRQLRQIMNTALYSTPAVLYWLPDGATSPTYFEIYSADVQATGNLNNPDAGFTTAEFAVTWTRSAVGGRLTSGETLLNAVTFANTGTGSPDNVESLGSSGAGDLIYDGQPMNIQLVPSASTAATITTVYAASVLNRTYSTASSGAYSTTTVVSIPGSSVPQFDLSPFQNLDNLRVRVMMYITSVSANAQVGATVFMANAVPTAPRTWVGPSLSTTVIDLGGFSIPQVQNWSTTTYTPVIYLQYWLRSTDGALASMTWSYAEWLLYYEFARFDTNIVYNSATNQRHAALEGHAIGSNRAVIPLPRSRAVGVTAFGSATFLSARYAIPRGTVPRYRPGTSLYLAWNAATTSQLTVTATQAPAYMALRGNG